jgi:hypothetical protein
MSATMPPPLLLFFFTIEFDFTLLSSLFFVFPFFVYYFFLSFYYFVPLSLKLFSIFVY